MTANRKNPRGIPWGSVDIDWAVRAQNQWNQWWADTHGRATRHTLRRAAELRRIYRQRQVAFAIVSLLIVAVAVALAYRM